MTTPILLATCFDATSTGPYARLARVFEYAAAQHCPGWIRLTDFAPAALHSPRHEPAFEANVHKMTRWTAMLERAADGDQILFVDVDTMILQPLDDLWCAPFDLAYTVKLTARYPFNTGVIAVRVSPNVRAFFDRWHETTRRLLADPVEHLTWRRRYGGIHQAALGALLERGGTDALQVCQLPCRVWNCEDSSWDAYDPAVTRIVHVKSALRRAVLGFAPGGSPALRSLVTVWRQLERAALAAEGAADHASRRARG